MLVFVAFHIKQVNLMQLFWWGLIVLQCCVGYYLYYHVSWNTECNVF